MVNDIITDAHTWTPTGSTSGVFSCVGNDNGVPLISEYFTKEPTDSYIHFCSELTQREVGMPICSTGQFTYATISLVTGSECNTKENVRKMWCNVQKWLDSFEKQPRYGVVKIEVLRTSDIIQTEGGRFASSVDVEIISYCGSCGS